MIRILFIILGTFFIGLGILGIFIPGLPTTPFVLLSAGLYVRSSERLYNKLISNKYLGEYIVNFQKDKGMTLRSKLYSIILMWIMIFISAFCCIDSPAVRIIIISVGIIGTYVMGFLLKTINK